MQKIGINRMKKMKREDLVALILELTEENEMLRKSKRESTESIDSSNMVESTSVNQTSEMIAQMKEIVYGMKLLRDSIEKATVGCGEEYEK